MQCSISQKGRPRNLLAVWTLFCIGVLLSSNVSASEPKPIPVVATLPVLQDFVQQVGGSRVSVHTLVRGLESEHTYTPKPSDIVAVSRARMLVKIGLGLEIWVDGLIRNAENRDVVVINTSVGIPLIKDKEEEPDRQPGLMPDRSFKERHTMGNPHIWLDPQNAKVMIRHITDGLIQIDPDHKGEYLRRQSDYFRSLRELEADIRKKVQDLPDRRIITHHSAWPYFARRFGFIVVDNIFHQVGAEPSAKHLQQLIDKIKKKGIKVVVSEPQLNSQVPLMIARETGIRVVILSPLPGALPGTDSYLELIRYNAEQLIEALRGSNP